MGINDKYITDVIDGYKKLVADQNEEIEKLRKIIDMVLDSSVGKKMEHAFNESRLTHPMLGFKHKDFKEYTEWIKKYPPPL